MDEKKKILLIERFGMSGRAGEAELVEETTNSAVKLIYKIDEAKKLQEDYSFDVVVIEPFMAYSLSDEKTKGKMLEFLIETIKRTPVIAYSTETEQEIISDFGMKKGTHYDRYVPKIGSIIRPGGEYGAEMLKRTIDELVG